MNSIVITPSVRAFPPEYFESVKDQTIIVIDDSDGKADRSQLPKLKNIIYADNAFVKAYLDPTIADLIPHHNPSCKNFGLWYAWKEQYDMAILLDDDCDTRITPNFMDLIPVGKEVDAIRSSTNSGWINPLNEVNGARSLVSRGYPYQHRYEDMKYVGMEKVRSSFNEGLWVNEPDINGIDKLMIDPDLNPRSWQVPIEQPYRFNSLRCPYGALSVKQHLPLSIMNVQLDTDLIPAFFQPSDYQVWNKFKIRRHDDIWSCYTLKSIMDVIGDTMTFGEPFVHHTKNGNPKSEILSEHCTNLIQGQLTDLVDQCMIVASSTEHSYGAMAYSLADEAIKTLDHMQFNRFNLILTDYMQGVMKWANACDYLVRNANGFMPAIP